MNTDLGTEFPTYAEEIVWRWIPPEHIWVLDKLILSKYLNYNCGPVGIDVSKPGWYIVRPCVNALGLGFGAEKVWLEKDTTHLPYGYFWCEWFEGNHYSVDYFPRYGTKVFTVQGFRPENDLIKWDKWMKVDNIETQRIPECVWSVVNQYHRINIEYIDDKVIEVHLRENEDFDGSITEFIPVWKGQDTTPPDGYEYRYYPDIHGRIGAFVK